MTHNRRRGHGTPPPAAHQPTTEYPAMKERRGSVAKNERMHPDEAKARIIRFNEGGPLFDFSNEYLGIDHLRCICDSLIYTQQRKDFLYAIMSHSRQEIDKEALQPYKTYSRHYKNLRRQANKLYREIEAEGDLLF